MRLPPEIEFVDEPDRLIYRLPRRDLGAWRYVSIPFLLIGFLIVAQALNSAWHQVIGLNRPVEAQDATFAVLAILIGLALSYIPLGLGLAIAWGHREIELRRGKLCTTERAGPFWRTKRWRIANIEGFSVIGLSGESTSTPNGIAARLDALVGHLRTYTRFIVAPGYSRRLLSPLASHLAERCDRIANQQAAMPREPIRVSLPNARKHRLQAVAITGAPNAIDRDDSETADTPLGIDRLADEKLVQPAASKVAVERTTTGLTLNIPAAGVWHGSRGLMFFAVIWCGFLALMTTVAITAKDNAKQDNVAVLLAFLGLFWLVGLTILLAAINMGRRRAVIAVVNDELMVLQTSLFRSKSQQWKGAEVTAVRAGPSGMTVNDVPVLELQVFSATQKKFGLLAGRDEDELRWLADEIAHTLGISATPESAPEALAPDVEAQPPQSRIAVERFPQGFSLDIPAPGIWKGSQGFVGLGLVLIAVMTGVTVAEIYFGMSIWEHPIATLVTLVFWSAAIAVLLAGLNIGTRRGAIAVVRDELMVMQTGLLGAKKCELKQAIVAAVRAAPAGYGKDFDGLVELRVLSTDGKKLAFFCGRPKEELFWIATLVRQSLNVPAQAPHEADVEQVDADIESDDADSDSAE